MIDARQDSTASASEGKVARCVGVVDPSDAVTGIGMVFGAIGMIVGVIAAVVVSPDFSLYLLGYCALAALAGGSVGIVTGGMIGAILAVANGVVPQRDIRK
ncbi:hypothetical protein P6U16_21990 (plasmid) [Rhizobium sp. 32-5/1]|uniref:hypothetical protein n=1 Tax=Rhizobium sp. 32-5/1 TaxID=3019602 RepID=UPI00240E7005|nr:hypothetical protein [Rhizobium sp. 32-5/1]WEZ85730.1 hypothetical protein P6U16_21990 [Rhizobium sp. 32-5/1]